MDSKTDPKTHLRSLLTRVLADGTIDEGERAELQAFYANAMLSVTDVKAVFGEYLEALKADVMADGIITDEERKRCRNAIVALKIPRALLSPVMAFIVDGK
jgi:uncharacterized membrane protein YebE (DUF533 family)